MTAFNVSGLVSGIDTSSLISQLMTVAAAPQTALQNQVTTDQAQISAYQSINSQLAVDRHRRPDAGRRLDLAGRHRHVVGFFRRRQCRRRAPVAATTPPSRFSRSPPPRSVRSSATAATIADPSAGIDIVGSDSVSHHVSLTDGSPAGVAAAINAAGLGVRAAVVNTDNGSVLQLTSTSTGLAGAFAVNGLTGVPQTLVAAQDAQISVGDPANGGYTISSSTNTFTNAIPGVTFTVSASRRRTSRSRSRPTRRASATTCRR